MKLIAWTSPVAVFAAVGTVVRIRARRSRRLRVRILDCRTYLVREERDPVGACPAVQSVVRELP